MTSKFIPLLWQVEAIMRVKPDELDMICISVSEAGCFMSYLCSCSGAGVPRRVVTAVVGCDDTAVKSGVVCAPASGCPAPHTTSYRVSVQTEAADWAKPGLARII